MWEQTRKYWEQRKQGKQRHQRVRDGTLSFTLLSFAPKTAMQCKGWHYSENDAVYTTIYTAIVSANDGTIHYSAIVYTAVVYTVQPL